MAKRHGFFDLLEQLDGPISAVRQAGAYILVKSKSLKFLDVLKFTSGRCSLRSYLKDFEDVCNLEGGKDWFPYSKISDKMTMTSQPLPSYEDFEDFLCGCNSLNEENEKFQTLIDKGLTIGQALKQMNLKEPPPTGQERYTQLCQHWRDKKLKNLYELLVYYTKQDIEPLLKYKKPFINFFC